MFWFVDFRLAHFSSWVHVLLTQHQLLPSTTEQNGVSAKKAQIAPPDTTHTKSAEMERKLNYIIHQRISPHEGERRFIRRVVSLARAVARKPLYALRRPTGVRCQTRSKHYNPTFRQDPQRRFRLRPMPSLGHHTWQPRHRAKFIVVRGTTARNWPRC